MLISKCLYIIEGFPLIRASGDYYGRTNNHLLNFIYFWSPCSNTKTFHLTKCELSGQFLFNPIYCGLKTSNPEGGEFHRPLKIGLMGVNIYLEVHYDPIRPLMTLHNPICGLNPSFNPQILSDNLMIKTANKTMQKPGCRFEVLFSYLILN